MSNLNLYKSLAIAEKYIKFCTWTYDTGTSIFYHSDNLFKILDMPVSDKPLTIQLLSELLDVETKRSIAQEIQKAIQQDSEIEIRVTFKTYNNSIKNGIIKA